MFVSPGADDQIVLNTDERLIMMKQDIKITDASLQSQSKDVKNILLVLKWGKSAKNSLREFYCERYQTTTTKMQQ